jgi:hypothetical protein
VQIFASAISAESGWASARAVSDEPQYIIMNFGISQWVSRHHGDARRSTDRARCRDWGQPLWDELTLPAEMLVDYVRVYQPANRIATSCDPPSHPTKQYIEVGPRC